MDVLDHEHHGLPRAQAGEPGEHLFEQPGPGGVAIYLQVPRQQFRGGARVPAQRCSERGEWQAAAAEVHAAAVQHLGLDVAGEVPDQSGLADPGFTADQHRGR